MKQKRGITMIEPNENLSEVYIKEADETLSCINQANAKWNIIMSYYSCYSALYSILMKSGIRCEIHDCTIALSALIEGFTSEDTKFLENLKKDRIGVQYHLQKKKPRDVSTIKEFVLKCKSIRESIDGAALILQLKQYAKGDEN